jgi:hypothetical protein
LVRKAVFRSKEQSRGAHGNIKVRPPHGLLERMNDPNATKEKTLHVRSVIIGKPRSSVHSVIDAHSSLSLSLEFQATKKQAKFWLRGLLELEFVDTGGAGLPSASASTAPAPKTAAAGNSSPIRWPWQSLSQTKTDIRQHHPHQTDDGMRGDGCDEVEDSPPQQKKQQANVHVFGQFELESWFDNTHSSTSAAHSATSNAIFPASSSKQRTTQRPAAPARKEPTHRQQQPQQQHTQQHTATAGRSARARKPKHFST